MAKAQRMLENTNTSGTYAWMIYQLYSNWMSNLRYSFYLSPDLAELFPRDDFPRSYEETTELMKKHMKSVEEKQDALVKNYNKGILILQSILASSDVPLRDRGDITYGEHENEDGTWSLDTVTKKDMDVEMKRIIDKYENGEGVTALEIALKNAYAMYRGKRSFNDENIKAEIFILNQVKASASNSLAIMSKILAMVPKLQSDYIFEIKAKGNDKFENKTKDEINEIFYRDVGGMLTPFGDTEAHADTLDRVRRANSKGMGESANRFDGAMETPEFNYEVPVLFSPPGAGKNSIVEQMAEFASTPFFTINFPQTTESDFTMPAYNPKSGVVSSNLTGNMWEAGACVGVILGDECLRVNREGRTGMDSMQDFMLHGRLSPQNMRYKRNPGTLVIFATNTDRDSKIGETEMVGQANKDRAVFFEISEDMIQTGRQRYLREKYGKKLKPGTPLYSFYEYLASNDPNLGAGPLLNKADVTIESNYVDMKTPQPSGRPMTQLLEKLMMEGQHRVSMDRLHQALLPIAGSAFAARFKTFAKISNALPSIEDMLKTAQKIPQALSTVAFDIVFDRFDRDKGKFCVAASQVSPESIYFMNGGKGLPKNQIDQFKNDPKKQETVNGKKQPRKTFLESMTLQLNAIDSFIEKATDKSKKESLVKIKEQAKEGVEYLASLDMQKVAKEVEGHVNSIFKIGEVEGDAKKLISNGMNDPMIQKMFADRIVTSFESYVESCYRNKEPLNRQKVRDFLTLIPLCPFRNHMMNMLSQVKNLLVNIPSDSVKEGVLNYGIAGDDGAPVTGNSIAKGTPGMESFPDDAKIAMFYTSMPIHNQAQKYSTVFQTHNLGRKNVEMDVNMSSDDNMSL